MPERLFLTAEQLHKQHCGLSESLLYLDLGGAGASLLLNNVRCCIRTTGAKMCSCWHRKDQLFTWRFLSVTHRPDATLHQCPAGRRPIKRRQGSTDQGLVFQRRGHSLQFDVRRRLMRGKRWVLKYHLQHRAVTSAAVVPHFMQKRVIKESRLSVPPWPSLLGHRHVAARGAIAGGGHS